MNGTSNEINQIGANLNDDVYTQNIMSIDALTLNSTNVDEAPIYVLGFYTSEIYLNEVSITNSISPEPYFRILVYNKVEITNFAALSTESTATNLIRVEYANEINIKNFTLTNFASTGGLADSVVYLNPLPYGITSLSNWSITDSNIGKYDLFYLNPIMTGSFFAVDLTLTNITLGAEAMILRTATINTFQVANSTFNEIVREDKSDDTSTIVYIGAVDLLETGLYSISGITIENSPITFFRVSNVNDANVAGKQLEISSLKIMNSYSQYSIDIILFESLETNSDFEIVLSNIQASNLTFESTGNIFKFQQQTASPLILKDCNFHDLYGVNIYIESSNLANHDLLTNVKMINITAENVSSFIKSFIVNNEGGYLEIHNSSFTNMDNVEGGAVITGGYQYSQTLIYNSTFTNNTSLYGGVVYVHSGSVIKFFDCELTSNFAIQSGVIQASDDGYFEIYNSTVTSNSAFTVPISEIYISSPVSKMSNTTISNNLALSKESIASELSK